MLRDQSTSARHANTSNLARILTSRFAILIAAFGLTLCNANGADIFDATTDFSITNNPNGVWSSGYQTSLNSSLVLFDVKTSVPNSYWIWTSSITNNLNTPSVLKNIQTSGSLNGLPPNMISLHPGPNIYATLRFTAPKTASYSLELNFFAGDGGETDAYAILNNDTNNPLYYSPITSNNPSFNSVLNLISGDKIDILVGPAGGFGFDTTPLTFRLTEQVVPEPHTIILSLISVIMAFASRRRKWRTAQAA